MKSHTAFHSCQRGKNVYNCRRNWDGTHQTFYMKKYHHQKYIPRSLILPNCIWLLQFPKPFYLNLNTPLIFLRLTYEAAWIPYTTQHLLEEPSWDDVSCQSTKMHCWMKDNKIEQRRTVRVSSARAIQWLFNCVSCILLSVASWHYSPKHFEQFFFFFFFARSTHCHFEYV